MPPLTRAAFFCQLINYSKAGIGLNLRYYVTASTKLAIARIRNRLKNK